MSHTVTKTVLRIYAHHDSNQHGHLHSPIKVISVCTHLLAVLFAEDLHFLHADKKTMNTLGGYPGIGDA